MSQQSTARSPLQGPVLYRRGSVYTTVDPGASALIAEEGAASVTLASGLQDHVQVQVTDFEAFSALLPQVARRHDIALHSVRPTDESLESVFGYLVEGR